MLIEFNLRAIPAKFAALLAGALVLTAPVNAQLDLDAAASEDSQAFVAAFEQEYGAYIDDYLRVFMGEINCQYPFVIDEEFNALADDMLRRASEQLATRMASRLSPGEISMSPEMLAYAARLSVLSVVEAYANHRSAEFQAEIDADEEYCQQSVEPNRARYAGLVEFMAARQPD
ncbi:hypothetical protein [uncultured Maricaulis sp.]|uniref:hypothetical protein n=1 Tax=uncultured Maricaulis sp. TaxID=174710 RepID=UPI00260D8675|nr:hypothetical protein [uncultured Maricaulis sp.]